MLGKFAERALGEVALIRMVLDGTVDLAKLPPVAEAVNETDHRRLVALVLANRLSCMLTDLHRVADDAESNLAEKLWGWEIANEEIPEPKRVFGFAACRKAA